MPLSDCEVRDPRVRRTRQLLQRALTMLLQTRNFEEISVQDIAETATVNRATFYDHYSDKFSLVESMVAGGFHQLLHEREVMYDGTCPSAARAIIEAVCDYLVLVHQGHPECKGQSSFDALMDSALSKAIRRVILSGIADSNHPASMSLEMSATIASYAIYGAAREWSQSPNRPPADQIVPQILTLVMPILPVREPNSTARPAPHTSIA